MLDLAIESCGMVTAVGLNAPATCAAIRCGLTNVAETRFIDSNGEWIMGSEVPMERSWRGLAKLARMAAAAISDCLAQADLKPIDLADIPIILCLAESDRPGRIQHQEENLLPMIEALVGTGNHMNTTIVAQGRVGGVRALEAAARLIARHNQQCMLVAADSYLAAGTITAYEKRERILTTNNSDGFIPGEAAAAVLISAGKFARKAVVSVHGLGFGEEIATIESDQPLRADGMVEAVKNALSMAGQKLGDLDFRICDLSGEQYGFKEAALVLTRLLREKKEEFDIWHPAECTGESGAASVLIALAIADDAIRKGYSKGDGILYHTGNDDGARAALVLNRNIGNS